MDSSLKITFPFSKYSNDEEILGIERFLKCEVEWLFFWKIQFQKSWYGSRLSDVCQGKEKSLFVFLRGGLKLNVNHWVT